MQRDTRKVIQRKFLILLRDTPIHKITVKQICDISNVNRSTFYYYYRDVYAVLEAIESDWLINFKKLLSKFDPFDLQTFFTILLDDLKANHSLYAPVFSKNAANQFSKKFIDISYDFIMKSNPGFPNTQSFKWSFYYSARGSTSVILLWLFDGCVEPVEDVARFLSESFRLSPSRE